MDRTDDRRRQLPEPDSRWSLSRRRLLAGGTGLATVAVVPRATTAQTQDEEPDEGISTEVGLSADAPTFDRADHEGLFVEVQGESDATVPEGATACEFLGADPVPYAVRLLDPTEETENREMPSESAPIYARQGDEEIAPETFFVIARTHPCSDDFLAAELEQTDQESIEGDIGPGTGQDESPGA